MDLHDYKDVAENYDRWRIVFSMRAKQNNREASQ